MIEYRVAKHPERKHVQLFCEYDTVANVYTTIFSVDDYHGKIKFHKSIDPALFNRIVKDWNTIIRLMFDGNAEKARKYVDFS